MSTETFPLIGGRRMRATRLDLCGVPAWGDAAQLVSGGFVSVAVTANWDDGTEVVLRNAAGERCVQRDANAEFINYALTVTFCEVNPDLYSGFTGYPKVLDPETGEVIGFRTNRAIRPSAVRNALELWSDAQGNAGCDDEDLIPYGYFLWPFLSGARVGDYTIEDGAVTFSVTQALTRDGSQWGVGPYLVTRDAAGDPDFLQEAIEALDHDHVQRTTVPPPAVTDGFIPLDDPDTGAATTSTAGIPGTWNGRRPATLALLVASAITGSGGVTPWTTGQYVIVGDGSHAYWAGSGAVPKWEAGEAP